MIITTDSIHQQKQYITWIEHKLIAALQHVNNSIAVGVLFNELEIAKDALNRANAIYNKVK